MSAAVYHGQEQDNALSDLLLVEMGKDSRVTTVERQGLQLILGELSLHALTEDAAKQATLAKILGVDCFVWIDSANDQAIVHVVDAKSGRSISRRPHPIPAEKLPGAIPDLAREALADIHKGLPVIAGEAPSVAFALPQGATERPGAAGDTERLAGELSRLLAASQVAVLERRFALDMTRERFLSEKGFIEAGSTESPFLGASHIVVLDNAEEADNLIVTILDARTGRRLGRMRMPAAEATATAGTREIGRWLADHIRPALSGQGVKPGAEPASRSSIPELLATFYAGIALHNQGRYLEALPTFSDVAARNPYLREVDAWIASSLRLAGFPEIAEAMPLHKATKDTTLPPPQELASGTQPGVALLGVTAGEAVPTASRGELAILLVDSLHVVTGQTVLASEDLGLLRDEYDVLVGLENVKGTTWQKAPPLLLEDAVTGHLEKQGDRLVLRLCRVQHCSPAHILDAVGDLPEQRERWPSTLQSLVRRLFPEKQDETRPWTPPHVILHDPETEILARLKKNYSDWDYLRLLLRNPSHTEYLSKYSSPRLGLERWLLRTLPADHPDRPWIEFAMQNEGDWRQIEAYQRLREKYPRHPVELLAHFNVLVLGLTPDNVAATEPDMSRIVSDLKAIDPSPHVPEQALAAMESVSLALRYALGRPGGKPTSKLISRGSVLSVSADLITWPGGVTGGPVPEFLSPDSPEKMMVDIAAFAVLRDRGELTLAAFTGMVERFGRDSEAARYAVIKYAPMLLNRIGGYPEEDLRAVIRQYADAAESLLHSNPVPLSLMDASTMVSLMGLVPLHLADPAARDAVRRVQRAAFHAVAENRLGPGDPCYWLLIMLPNADDPECRQILQDRCEASWAEGPLKNPFWLTYCWMKTQSPKVRAAMYAERVQRLHQLYDGEPKSARLARLYTGFGIALFCGGYYRESEPLMQQVLEWKDDQGRPPDHQSFILCLYLSAQVKFRNRDIPAALNLARQALEKIGDCQYPLYEEYTLGGNGQYAGRNASLKELITKLVALLRDHSDAPFVSPYGEPR